VLGVPVKGGLPPLSLAFGVPPNLPAPLLGLLPPRLPPVAAAGLPGVLRTVWIVPLQIADSVLGGPNELVEGQASILAGACMGFAPAELLRSEGVRWRGVERDF